MGLCVCVWWGGLKKEGGGGEEKSDELMLLHCSFHRHSAPFLAFMALIIMHAKMHRQLVCTNCSIDSLKKKKLRVCNCRLKKEWLSSV